VVVYNSLSVERSSVIHLPVSTKGLYSIRKVGDDDDDVTIVSAHSSSKAISNQSAGQVVSFLAGPLPALGASVYKVVLVGNTTSRPNPVSVATRTTATTRALAEVEGGKDIEASNGLFSVVFDG
jgi:hypothetical protein